MIYNCVGISKKCYSIFLKNFSTTPHFLEKNNNKAPKQPNLPKTSHETSFIEKLLPFDIDPPFVFIVFLKINHVKWSIL